MAVFFPPLSYYNSSRFSRKKRDVIFYLELNWGGWSSVQRDSVQQCSTTRSGLDCKHCIVDYMAVCFNSGHIVHESVSAYASPHMCQLLTGISEILSEYLNVAHLIKLVLCPCVSALMSYSIMVPQIKAFWFSN